MFTAVASSPSSSLSVKTKSRTCHSRTRPSSSSSNHFLCSFRPPHTLLSPAPILATSFHNSQACHPDHEIGNPSVPDPCFYYAHAPPSMKGGYGSFGGGATTLQPAPLDLSQNVDSDFEPLLDTGGDGGENGRNNYIGGGGGSGGGDDDEYNWNNIDPEDDNGGDEDLIGIFKRRNFIFDIFDREVVDAVLSEWMKTMKDLPLGLKQAYTMGMLSSGQFTRFLSFNARPAFTRFLCRSLTDDLCRDFNGKMIADPSLPHKLLLELFSSLGFSLWLDYKQRGIEKMKKEWNLVLTNAITIAACNSFAVWSLAPCYRYGEGFGFQWLNSSRKLPNNVFEGSYRFLEFNPKKRGLSYCYKAVNLFMLGVGTRLCQIGLSTVSEKDKKDRKLNVADAGVSALGAGISMGLYSNLRYQLLCGIDRGLLGYFDVMGVSLFLGSALRALNANIGAQSLSWVGDRETLPVVHSLAKLEQASVSLPRSMNDNTSN